jgi:hypothetical protein
MLVEIKFSFRIKYLEPILKTLYFTNNSRL